MLLYCETSFGISQNAKISSMERLRVKVLFEIEFFLGLSRLQSLYLRSIDNDKAVLNPYVKLLHK